eukprot:CAMPEP_0174239718 /NCGR_PEP_ID=MMETSP0417-20130205/15787_1 /TAXON_ID=242541 /ORGANISM="Mayorella sp, Strain BSH-02190019" /LENGTH=254 /DNA_ID=CAMNT_0015318685 /DNA_START=23 /DNA_END=787 /DNA_ORIENTATION=-
MSSSAAVELVYAADESDFVSKGVQLLGDRIRAAIASRGSCLLGLSGGSTPKAIYTALGAEASIDWTKVTVFLVDDRHCPPDSSDSNQRLLQETLIASSSLEPHSFSSVLPNCALEPAACVEDYGKQLSAMFKAAGRDQADLLVLGMGEDGHIASLFPPLAPADLETSSLTVHKSAGEGFAVANRISITMPVIQRSHSRIFLLKGAGKQTTWESMMSAGDSIVDRLRWPAKNLLAGGVTALCLFPTVPTAVSAKI